MLTRNGSTNISISINNNNATALREHRHEKDQNGIYYIALLSVTVILHVLIQRIIRRKHLNDNQYHLIRVLSISDLFAVVASIILNVYSIFQDSTSKEMSVLLSLSIYIGLSYSLIVTLVIAVDRWIAVKWCLHYYILIRRYRINIVLVIAGVVNAVTLTFLFYIFGVSSSEIKQNFYTSFGASAYLTTIRIVTCIVIIVLGKWTIFLRNQSEIRLKNRTNIHGREAEKLDRTKQLKRSIKDVFKLNLWTCIFHLPLIVTAIFMILDSTLRGRLLYINVLATAIYKLSNPIIYLTCFSKIRKYWMSFFRRQVNPHEN